MHGFERNEAGKLFVGGLSWDTTKDSLLAYFSQYGEVIDCVVMKNPETGKSRGFGFVTYRDTSCVDTVLSVPAHIVDGRQVDPKACNPKGAGRGGRGEGGGGGGHMGGEQHQRMNRGPRGGDRGGPHGDKKIFLGGLPNGADEEAIRNFFGQYGKVLEVTVMYDAQKQRSRGFGFLTFESEDAVNQVCREHYINFNGKKVECKRATPRTQGNQAPQLHIEEHHGPPPPQQIHVTQPGALPHMEMQPPPGAPGMVPGPDGQWSAPEAWNPQVHQAPPGQQIGVPPQFQQPGVQFQHGYQTEVPPGAPPGWPQQAPPVQAAGWPPGAAPQQPGIAPPPTQFTVAQTFAQPAPGAPVYQYTAAAPGQPPAANGQALQQVAIAQPPPSSYGYTATSYASPAVAIPQTIAGRPYQDFASPQQVQVATTVATVPSGVPGSTAVTYSYPSPYGSPVPAGAAPPVPGTDPYAQAAALGHPQATVAVQAPTAQAAGVPGYGTPVAHVQASGGEPASPKAVDYSSYYSAYGYTVETTPTAVSAAAYGAQPAPAPGQAPVQAPYAVQEVPQAVAYGTTAPGPSPTFQRQSSGQQYHPYARR